MPYENPYSTESVEARLGRQTSFNPDLSGDAYDPGVLSNLNTSAEEMWEVEQQAMQRWKERRSELIDISENGTDEEKKAFLSMPDGSFYNPINYSFGSWAHEAAGKFAKEDPNAAEGYDPRKFAELMRELSRKETRKRGAEEEANIQQLSERLNWAGQGALAVTQGASAFLDSVSGGAIPAAIEGVGGQIAEWTPGGDNSQEWIERYRHGQNLMGDLTNRASSAVRWTQGAGGLLGYLVPLGAASKGATAMRIAAEAGKAGAKAGGKRFAFQRGVAMALGGAGKEAGGLAARGGLSAANFVTAGAGMDFVRALTEGARFGKFNETVFGNKETGEPGMLENAAHNALSGFSMPFFQKLSHAVVGAPLVGKHGNSIRRTISEIPSIRGKVFGTMANMAQGGIEFLGFSGLPTRISGTDGFGIFEDLYDALSTGGEDGRAWERVMGHVINGMVVKGSSFVRGKGRLGVSKKWENAQKLAKSPDTLDGYSAIAEAQRAADENLYIPTREEMDMLREQGDTRARQKIAHFVTARAIENTLGKDLAQHLTTREAIERIGDPEFTRVVQDQVNRAIEMVGRQEGAIRVVGKGPKVLVETPRGRVQREAKLTPEESKNLHARVAKEIKGADGTLSDAEINEITDAIMQRQGGQGRQGEGQVESDAITIQTRKDIQRELRKLSEATSPEMKEKMLEELFGRLMLDSSLARAAGAEGTEGEGTVEMILERASKDAKEHLDAKGELTPEDQIRRNVLELEDLYAREQATQDLDQKRQLVERMVEIEQVNELLVRQQQGVAEKEAEKIRAEQQEQIEPGSSIQRPLSVGEKTEPVDGPIKKGNVEFPPEVVQNAGGTRVRIQVGKYDKEGIFRSATVVAATPDAIIVRTEDGTFHQVTVEDVKAGRARGGILQNIAEGPGDYPVGKGTRPSKDAQDEVRAFERREITNRGDTIESLEYREPDPMFGRAPTPEADDILFALRNAKPGEGTREDFRQLREHMRAEMLDADAKDDAGRFIEATRIMQSLQKARGIGDGKFVTETHPKYPKPGEDGGAAGGVKKAPKKPKGDKGGARFGSKKAKKAKKAKKGKKSLKDATGEDFNAALNAVESDVDGEGRSTKSIKRIGEELKKRGFEFTEDELIDHLVKFQSPESAGADTSRERIKERDAEIAALEEALAMPSAEPTNRKPRFGSKKKRKKGKQTKGLRGTVRAQARRIEDLEGKITEAEREKFRDPLTGLPNKEAWDVARPKYEGRKGSAIWAGDLGNLKELNDKYDHATGDRGIVAVASHIASLAKQAGIPIRDVFRGGAKSDEFMIGNSDSHKIAKFNELLRAQPYVDIPVEGGKARVWIDGAYADKNIAAVQSEKAGESLSIFQSADRLAKEAKDARKTAAGQSLTRTGAAPAAGTPSPKAAPPRLGSKKKPKPKKRTNADVKDDIKTLATELGIDVGRLGRTRKDLDKQLADLQARKEGKVKESGGLTALHRIPGTPNVIAITDVPEGWSVYKAIKSGRNWTVLLKDKDGTIWIQGKGIGVKKPPKGWLEPAATKDISVVDADDNPLLRGPTTVQPDVGTGKGYDPSADTGRITSIEGARARIAGFRRRVPTAEGKADDPITRVFNRVGAMMADPNLSAKDVADQHDNLMAELRKRKANILADFKAHIKERPGESPQIREALRKRNDAEVKRIESAMDAIRRVREAKEYIETFERRRAQETADRKRLAAETNPAKDIENADEALTTSQRRARDLAVEYKAAVSLEKDRWTKRGKRAKIAGDKEMQAEARRTVDLYRKLERIADSLIDIAKEGQERTGKELSDLQKERDALREKIDSPESAGNRDELRRQETAIIYRIGGMQSGRQPINTALDALPSIQFGDTVSLVVGGERGGRLVEGLVVGSGEPTKASLRRGMGPKGQNVRRLLARQRKGKSLTADEEAQVRAATIFPGAWMTIFTTGGKTVRVRTTDIAEVGPAQMNEHTFSYDPGRNRMGVEVSERRFLSWFGNADKVATSQSPKGTGDAAQSSNRVEALLAGETEGYMQASGRGNDFVVQDLTPLEAAEMEARVRASQVRNRTLTPEQAMLEANSYLVKNQSNVRVMPFEVGGKEERGPGERQGRVGRVTKKGTLITGGVRYFDPKEPMLRRDELADDDPNAIKYDHWLKQSEEADAVRIAAEKSQGEQGEARKLLIPLEFNDDNGTFIFAHRTRNDRGTIRQGRIVFAERTPEGTIHARNISLEEAREWLISNGKGDQWDAWKRETATEYNRMRTRNRSIVTMAKGDTMLHEYGALLFNQFERIAKDPKGPVFPHEGDLHQRVREWLADNPYPGVGADREAAWEREWENFLYRQPGKEREFDTTFTDVESGVIEKGVGQEDFFGTLMHDAGPLYIAEQRMLLRQNPSNGDQLIYDKATDSVRYKDPEAEARDFYKAYAQNRGVDLEGRPRPFHPGTLGIFGLGMLPGGASRHMRNLFGYAARKTTDALDAYHKATNFVASPWSQVLHGVTDFSKAVTDTVFFDHLHDLLHHPDYGSTLLGQSGKAFAKKVGILFGESDEAPLARMHLNDYEGDLYGVGEQAAGSLKKFRKLDNAEQLRLMKEFESGKTPKILEEYRDIIDALGKGLVEVGLLKPEDLTRFAGKYIHYGRWKWKRGPLKEAYEKAKATYADLLSKDAPVGEVNRALIELNILKRAWAKMEIPMSRAYIGSSPVHTLSKGAMKGIDTEGVNRFRTHKNLQDAINDGLDADEPWRLLLEGISVEGRALAQARLYQRVAQDPNLVKPINDAPSDWISVTSLEHYRHPVWKQFHNKSIQPQMFHLLEANNPDYNRASQAWDMFHGLIKSSYTVGNLSNWHTQILGNAMIVGGAAGGIPFFQIPTRFGRAFMTLAGVGKKSKENLEKYKRWNWTRHASDAVRELARATDRSAIETGGGAETSPYLGMSFFEKLGEIVTSIRSGRVKRAGRGVGIALVDMFTSLDAMARIAMHEWQVEQGMGETESRQRIDKMYDIQHLPKGWQTMRKYVDSFASIKALMGRNLAEFAPATPSAMVNLGMARIMHNMIMQAMYGYDDEEAERVIDTHVPKENAFHEAVSRNLGFLWPKGNGTLGLMDMTRFSPTDVALRGIPGARQVVSGLESAVTGHGWQPDMDGFGVLDGIWNYGTQNIAAGGTINYIADRSPYSPKRSMRDQYQSPGIFGLNGWPRYMLEDGPGAAIIGATLPAGLREAVAPLAQSTIRGVRRFAQTTETGKVAGIPLAEPRFVTEVTKDGTIQARQFSKGEATMEAFGFRPGFGNPFMRMQEELGRDNDLVESSQYGLKRTREAKGELRGTPESLDAKQAVLDSRNASMLNRAHTLVAMVRALDQAEDRSQLAKQVKRQIGSKSTLRRMLKLLGFMGETEHIKTVVEFLGRDENRSLIPVDEREAGLGRGRLGSMREDK